MTKRFRSSVRVRMTLWSMAIIAIVLVGFGVINLIITEKMLFESVDRDLLGQAEASERVFSAIEAMENSPGVPFGASQLPEGILPPTVGRDVSAVVIAGSGQVLGSLGSDPKGTLEGEELLGEYVLRRADFRRRISRGETTFLEVSLSGKRYRVLASPIPDASAPDTFLLMSYPVDEIYNLLESLRSIFLVLLPIVLGITYCAGLSVTRKALQPVRQITLAASKLGADDLAQRLPVTGDDEFSDLAETFNGMFGRLQSSFTQLEQSVEQQKRFVADASHELRTPLTVIRGSASWALEKARPESEYRDALSNSNEAAIRMEQLISDLLSLAKSDAKGMQAVPSDIPASDFLQTAAKQFSGRPDWPTIRVEPDPSDLTIHADRDMMDRVIGNLLENAIRHTPPSGIIRIGMHEANNQIELVVEDSGAGISEADLPHVFDRFYRVDHARSAEDGGSGLGLALCKEMMEAQGGSISIESQVGVGTRASIWIPQAVPRI